MGRTIYRISDTAEDCKEYFGGTSGFYTNTLGTGLENNVLNYRVKAGIRFTNIKVDQAATIYNAQLLTYTTGTWVAGGSYGTWYGDDVDNASAFSGSISITQTTANVAASVGTGDDKQITSCNVTAIVQEIVDRAGWDRLNAIRFATSSATADGYVEYYDYSVNSDYSPFLIIDTATDITGHADHPFNSA